MRKVALVFVLAVIVPSLVLAWLAVRSLRDQQFLIERQQALLDQRVTDSVAQNISDFLGQQQQAFSSQVENLNAGQDAHAVATTFDDQIRQRWPLAEVGFCVTLSGRLLCPSPNSRAEAKTFCVDNSGFLANRESVEVYWNANLANNVNPANNAANSFGRNSLVAAANGSVGNAAAKVSQSAPQTTAGSEINSPSGAALPKQSLALVDAARKNASAQGFAQNSVNYKTAQTRKVSPQSQAYQVQDKAKDAVAADEMNNNLSRVVPAEAEFAQLIGTEIDGMLARFLQNKLNLMLWHRLQREPDLIFGAQLNLNRVVDGLRELFQTSRENENDICLVLLDDNAKPVVISRPNFSANWKRPFVATEIGDALPHWEVAAYLVDPAALTKTACFVNLVLGLLIAVLVFAIVSGSWLIVRNLNSQLTLARQKTDFVSNVSHELKTPLTSIRMFSELLADGRVADDAKQKSYLLIISAEAARLTRLINNVLDFSRMERGEKKYNFQPCDLNEIVRGTAGTFRPHLEAGGFKFDCELTETNIFIRGDADALSQIIVNLLSNAEKYSNVEKEITLQLWQQKTPLPHAEIRVLDRGSGVPRGCEGKVFEKFYRAHDALSSGIQGSGLGLTIARQIARAHGGDVTCEPRDRGGSCFVVRLPISTTDEHE
jgi:signal transduction histidine kinase